MCLVPQLPKFDLLRPCPSRTLQGTERHCQLAVEVQTKRISIQLLHCAFLLSSVSDDREGSLALGPSPFQVPCYVCRALVKAAIPYKACLQSASSRDKP